MLSEQMLEQAGLAFEEGDLRYELVKVMTSHWLTSTGCSHEGEGSNTPACWCGWVGPQSKNVGTAVAHHAAHVLEEMRPTLAGVVNWGDAP